MTVVLVSFLILWLNTWPPLTKKTLGEKGFILIHKSRLECISVMKSQWQELKQQVTSHPKSKAERNECMHGHWLVLSSVSSFTQFRTLCIVNGATHSRLGLSRSVNLRQHPKGMPRDQPRGNPSPLCFSHSLTPPTPPLPTSSLMTLGCVKLTIKTNHHYCFFTKSRPESMKDCVLFLFCLDFKF